MQITLDYGKTGLAIEVPEERLICPPLKIRDAAPLADPASVLEQALAHPIGTRPLAELAQGKKTACILVCDITRPVPNAFLLAPVLRALEAAGVPHDGITILVATGLHRPNEGAELVELVGEFVATNYRCLNHNGKVLEEHDYLGTTESGVPAWIDYRYVRAELKITIGLIEPHFMAGYSGGRKLICPGVAALETVKVWHGPQFLEHPNADTGNIDGNPVHETNTKIALMAGCDFIVNVCIDGQRRITWLGAGHMIEAWKQGVEFCRSHVKATVPEPVDIVVTSGAGYPLDTTWYQCIKGLYVPLSIVKPGGTIILAGSMIQGIGSPEFAEHLDDYRINGRYRTIGLGTLRKPNQSKHSNWSEMDEWQLIMFQKAMGHCKVKVVTHGLPPDVLRNCNVEPAESVEAAIAASLAEYGPNARIAVIPKGPYVLPCIERP
jgi:nickel-dependent lactate racemase